MSSVYSTIVYVTPKINAPGEHFVLWWFLRTYLLIVIVSNWIHLPCHKSLLIATSFLWMFTILANWKCAIFISGISFFSLHCSNRLKSRRLSIGNCWLCDAQLDVSMPTAPIPIWKIGMALYVHPPTPFEYLMKSLETCADLGSGPCRHSSCALHACT